MLKKRTTSNRRFWEALPGVTSWTILLLPALFSFFWPIGVAYFIIIFDAYWLVKAVVFAGHLIAGSLHMKRDTGIDWLKRCRATLHLEGLVSELKRLERAHFGFQAAKFREEWEEAERARRAGSVPDWRQLHHAVILAVYREGEGVLTSSLNGLLEVNYPRQKLIPVIALEARAGEEQRKMVERLREKYQGEFDDFLVIVHPDGLPGEIKAKGANVTWAAKRLVSYLEVRQIPLENVLLSVFDADTIPSREYFGALTYQYLIHPDRLQRSYQPIPLFNNNVWDVPALTRLVAFSASFWQMIESTRPYRLVTFSSQAIPLKTLVEIGFWDTDVVSEDSRIFYQAFYHFDGQYKVQPLFTPVSMDAVLGKGFWATLKAQYIQKRRWAYGIENFPYAVENAFQRDRISLWGRLVWPIRIFEGHVSWATSSLLIALGGWLPIVLNSDFRETVVAFNLPVLASRVLSFSWIGVLVTAWISFQFLPKRENLTRARLIEFFAQWLLVPLIGIFFGSIPALDAESRLMLGKYLGFKVTEKVRRSVIPVAAGVEVSKRLT